MATLTLRNPDERVNFVKAQSRAESLLTPLFRKLASFELCAGTPHNGPRWARAALLAQSGISSLLDLFVKHKIFDLYTALIPIKPSS